MFPENYTELWWTVSYSYESEDYTELADRLDAQVCEDEEAEEEEKVCCARDQIKVGTNGFLIELFVTVQCSLTYRLFYIIFFSTNWTKVTVLTLTNGDTVTPG